MLEGLAKHTMITYQLVAGGYVAHDQAASLRHQARLGGGHAWSALGSLDEYAIRASLTNT